MYVSDILVIYFASFPSFLGAVRRVEGKDVRILVVSSHLHSRYDKTIQLSTPLISHFLLLLNTIRQVGSNK